MTEAPSKKLAASELYGLLRSLTNARIGLGRVWQALPVGAMLEFQADHARARDAVHSHAAAVVDALKRRLTNWTIAPVVLATQARVALGDPIAMAMGARCVLMLIGERPGLSASDSLGAYLTWQPRADTRDSERNCVSNIRTPGGLSPSDAADKIAWLLNEARKLGATGVTLKDRFGEPALPLATEKLNDRT